VTPSISASSRICGWPAPLARRKDSASAAVSAVSMPVPSQATIRRPNATAPVPARSSSRRHSERPAAADRRRPARSAHRGDGAAWSPNRTHRRGAHSRSRRRRPRRSCRTRCGRRCADGDSPADADPAGQVAVRGTPRAADQVCTMDGRHERSPAHGALAPSRARTSCLPASTTLAEPAQSAYWRTPYVTGIAHEGSIFGRRQINFGPSLTPARGTPELSGSTSSVPAVRPPAGSLLAALGAWEAPRSASVGTPTASPFSRPRSNSAP